MVGVTLFSAVGVDTSQIIPNLSNFYQSKVRPYMFSHYKLTLVVYTALPFF